MRRFAAAVSLIMLMPGLVSAQAEDIKVGGTGAATGVLIRLGQAYEEGNKGDKVQVVPGLGSGGGISAVGEGAIDIAVSSRDLKADEKAKGLSAYPLFESPFIFVTSHPQPPKLTKADVVAIHNETMTAWPDGKPIKVILRPKSDSVTPFLHSHFEGMQPAMDKLRLRRDIPVAATDQDNVEMAEKTASSFAASTLVQWMTEAPRLKVIDLDGVTPSIAAMESGSYPLKARTVLVMKTKPSPAAERFALFLRSDRAQKIVRDSGAVSLLPAGPALTR